MKTITHIGVIAKTARVDQMGIGKPAQGRLELLESITTVKVGEFEPLACA